MLHLNPQLHLFTFNPKIILPHNICHVFVPCQIPESNRISLNVGWNARQVHYSIYGGNASSRRTSMRQLFAIQMVASGLEDTEVSSSQFKEFSVTTCRTDKANELKVNVDVFGTRTLAVFDDVFLKMVADAQPIPGFRRVKGGKTPNIPKDILLEILGPSKVFKLVIKKVINITITEYVQKEGLSVGKDMQVQQSYEDLEAAFEPGEHFKFEAILQCQDSN